MKQTQRPFKHRWQRVRPPHNHLSGRPLRLLGRPQQTRSALLLQLQRKTWHVHPSTREPRSELQQRGGTLTICENNDGSDIDPL